MTDETLLEAIDKMEKAVEHVQGQFATVRTGCATPRSSRSSWSSTTDRTSRCSSWPASRCRSPASSS